MVLVLIEDFDVPFLLLLLLLLLLLGDVRIPGVPIIYCFLNLLIDVPVGEAIVDEDLGGLVYFVRCRVPAGTVGEGTTDI